MPARWEDLGTKYYGVPNLSEARPTKAKGQTKPTIGGTPRGFEEDFRRDPSPPQWEDAAPGDNEIAQVFYEKDHDSPEKRAGMAGASSRRVGWTLRTAKGNKLVDAFGFKINPQSIGRQHATRAQLYATRSGFLVDNFGPGPVTITLQQLVGSGREIRNSAGIVTQIYTAREDIQRFVTRIYYPAIQRRKDPLRVYFHDNHLERGFEERVFFPAGALDIQRAVSMHNVWAVSLTMVGLERNPYGEVKIEREDVPKPAARPYRVRTKMTLQQLVRRILGKDRTKAREKVLLDAILDQNPQLKKKRREIEVRQPETGAVIETKVGRRGIVYPGETIILPR